MEQDIERQLELIRRAHATGQRLAAQARAAYKEKGDPAKESEGAQKQRASA